MRNLHDYFLAAGVIWQAYFDGKISLSERDGRLNYIRQRLHTLPTSH